MDKNYFMNRLANGESMEAIGAEIAAMMNAAMAEHTAKIEAEKAAAAAEADKAAAKRELIEEMIEIIQELAILEGMEGDEFEITDEEIDHLVEAFSELFSALREVKKLTAMLEAKPNTNRIVVTNAKSDDDILAEFAKMFS